MPRLTFIHASLLAFLCLSCSITTPSAPTTRPTTRPTTFPNSSSVTDLDRHPADPFAGAAARRATVLLFIGDSCPISNDYAPEIARIYDAYARQNIAFCLVYSDPTLAPRDARQHYRAYKFPCPAVLDPKLVLAHHAQATNTPEAAVFLPSGQCVYHGRIDDRWTAYARARANPTSRDLRDVLESITHDQPVTPRSTPSVGCPIPD